jgi:hypothetical protein
METDMRYDACFPISTVLFSEFRYSSDFSLFLSDKIDRGESIINLDYPITGPR